MFRLLLLSLILTMCSFPLSAQVNPFLMNGREAPPACDTIYYPVRDGIQMVEFDFETAFNFHLLSYHDMGQIPFYPGKTRNEYLFRDSSGTILQTYGIEDSVVRIISRFLRPPGYQNKDHHVHPFNEFDYYLHRKNNGYYNIFVEDRQGIMDSMGKVVIPPMYDAVSHIPNGFLIYQEKEWTLVPLAEPDQRIGPYKSYNDEGPFVYLFNENQYAIVYHLETGVQYDLRPYKLSSFDKARGYFMRREGDQWGLWDFVNDEVLIPYEYDRIVTYHDHGEWDFLETGICLVLKDQKYGLVDLEGRVHLPCKYDQIYPRYQSPRGFYKVELDGETFEIEIP